MKNIVLGSIIGMFVLIVGAGAVLYATREPAVNPDPNHTHADFAVYIEGRPFDFSADKYMSNPPASEETSFRFIPRAAAHDHEDENGVIPGREFLHLHDGNGHVIHRHKPGLSIGDFFTSIGFTMTETCLTTDLGRDYCERGDKKWQMFVNGSGSGLRPDYVFEDLDQILLTYNASEEEVQEQLATLSDDACLYSKTCPERGEPPAENCIADPSVPCVAPLE